MKMETRITLIVLCVYLFVGISRTYGISSLDDILGENGEPQLLVGVTQTGLDYAGVVGVEFLHRKLEGLVLPDVEEEVANVNVLITNLTLVEFPVADPDIAIIPGRGLRMRLSYIEPFVEAQYQFDIDMGFFTITKSGELTVTVEDMHIELEFTFTEAPSPIYPFTVSHDCDSDGDIHADFEGGWSDLFHISAKMLNPILENAISKQICKEVAKEIEKSMDTIPLTQNIEEDIEIDMNFTQCPLFSDKYIQTYHRGDVSYRNIPLNPPVIIPGTHPDLPASPTKMVYLSVREQVANGMARALFWSGLLEYTVNEGTRKHIPGDLLASLDLSCEMFSFCVNELISETSLLVIPIALLGPPRIAFRANNTVGVKARVISRVQLDLDGNKTPLVDVSVNVSVKACLTIRDQFLYADIKFEDISAHTEVHVLPVPNAFGISDAISNSLSAVVVAQIKLLENRLVDGFPIPQTELAGLLETELIASDTEGFMVIGTDLDINLEKLLEMIVINI